MNDLSSEESDDETEQPQTELEQRLLDIAAIINHLYKLSIRIRNPSLRAKSLRTTSLKLFDPDTGIEIFSAYRDYDRRFVEDLFREFRSDVQTAEDDYFLFERCSEAITMRRQYFKYWERHRK